jgi:transcription initiation factor TFIIB
MMNSRGLQSHKLMQQGLCPDCGGSEFITDMETGEIACSQCGLVLQEEMLDQKPEWRAFTPEERRSKVRVGSPSTLRQFDKGLSTTFQPYKDTYGKTLPVKERLKMQRLRKWNIRARMHSSVERNLSQAMHELTLLTDKLRIPPDVEENAALIYRKALERGLVRGRSIKGIAAASLYAACRLTRTPRSLKQIVEASTRNRKEIARCFRLIQRELNLSMPIDDPIKYVPKIASQVKLSQKAQNLAIQLLQQAADIKADVGKGPAGVAAAALYIASIMTGKKVTQKDLANAAGVTEVTVRNRYDGLDKSLTLGLRKMLRGKH